VVTAGAATGAVVATVAAKIAVRKALKEAVIVGVKRNADEVVEAAGGAGARSAAGAADEIVVNQPYARPQGATTRAQRESVQGQSCVDCGTIADRQVADHIDPLVKEYYRTGTIDVSRMRSLEAVQPQCPTCSARQGASLRQYSIAMRAFFGIE
jgi:CTP:molybdopterin cytidylyltransferase MocA